MTELPNWVYDLVAAIEQWEEDGHDPGGDATIQQIKAVCHQKWLNRVPHGVRETALAIHNYKRAEEPVPYVAADHDDDEGQADDEVPQLSGLLRVRRGESVIMQQDIQALLICSKGMWAGNTPWLEVIRSADGLCVEIKAD